MGLGLFLGGAATGAMSGYKLAQQYKDTQKQQGLERAYRQGSEVTSQFSPEQAAQMEAAASAINPETGQPYYNVSASPDGQYTFTTQGQEPLAGTMAPQYRLGAETGGTYTPAAPTEAQRHRGGLVSQQQYLASAGDPEEAAKIGERLQTSDVRDLQRKGLERAESQAVGKEADNTKLRGMYEERQGLTEGTPEYAAATAKIQSFRESIDYDASQAAKLTELGITAKKYELEKSKMEDNIWEGTASPEAFGKMLTEKYRDGNTYVAHVDKKTGVVHIIKDNSSDGEPPVTVATAPSWAALQDTTRQGSKKYAAAMVEQNIKFEHDKELKRMDHAEKAAARAATAKAVRGSGLQNAAGLPIVTTRTGYAIEDAEGNLVQYTPTGPDDVRKVGLARSPVSDKAAAAINEVMQDMPEKKSTVFGRDEANYKNAVGAYNKKMDAVLRVHGVPIGGPNDPRGKSESAISEGVITRAQSARPEGLPDNAVQAPDGRWGVMENGKLRLFKGQ